ncbi:hypothetical protein BH09BAC6_BH09BAC6_06910 [soil metagenome]|jgi:PAS domain S-box-containing protein
MLHQLLTALNDCTLAFDLDEQQYLFISPHVTTVFGHPDQDFHNDKNLHTELISIHCRDKIKALTEKLSAGDWIDLHYQVTGNNGNPKLLDEKRGLIKDEQTGHRVLISIIKEAAPGKVEAVDGFDEPGFLFERNPIPMWVYDVATLKFLKVNEAACINYGYTEHEFLGMTLHDIRPKLEQEKLITHLNGISLPGTATGYSNAELWKHCHKNGGLIYAEITGDDVMYQNRPCRIIIAADVTEKHHYKEKSNIREQFLNSLIDSQTNFLIRIDTEGIYSFINKRFLKALGYKKNEVIGKHFSGTSVPEDVHLCQNAFDNCINQPGKVIRLKHKKVDKEGNVVDIEWEFIAVTTEDGNVSEIQGIGQDISHKIKIENEIKKTAEKLDVFIESINDYFIILNNDWEFVRVNTAFEKAAGKTRDEILGTVIWDTFPVILGTAFENTYKKAAAEHVSIQFIEHVQPANRWFNTSVYPSAEGLTIFIKDITEERRSQEEMTWTKNNLEALINNTEDQIWSVDKETRYVYMNKAYRYKIAELTGVEPKEGDYSYLHTGYNAEIIEKWNEYYSRALKGERYVIINESIDPLTQQVLSFEVSFNPIYKTKGDITGVGCFARNITAWLKTEKAILDQNIRLRNIASLSSHELRRPVASMLGLINLMDHKNFFNPENEEIIAHLLTVGNEIDDVIRLIVDETFMEGRPNDLSLLRAGRRPS